MPATKPHFSCSPLYYCLFSLIALSFSSSLVIRPSSSYSRRSLSHSFPLPPIVRKIRILFPSPLHSSFLLPSSVHLHMPLQLPPFLSSLARSSVAVPLHRAAFSLS